MDNTWSRLSGWLRSWLGGSDAGVATESDPSSPPSTTVDGRGRVSGSPPSANGASSFHLFWDLPGRFVEVNALFQVTEPPKVAKLYFWALQVDFARADGHPAGGAHTGLQYHPDYPNRSAINWGGYAADGSILTGTRSPLRSSAGNPHTSDFDWVAGRPYRLRVFRADAVTNRTGIFAWSASVTDETTGATTFIRDLFTAGEALVNPMCWSEVFARCDDPSVEVRWSELQAIDETGQTHRPDRVRLNYQAHNDGGCANTDINVDSAGGVRQRTNTRRDHPQGSVLARSL